MQNPIAVRLLNQQLVSPQFSKPEDVVAHFGAIQAQDVRMMRWAVAMRMRKPSHQAFEEAFNAGRIVRLHLMRGTWQLVSADDYWWMLDLCADRCRKVINGWQISNGIIITEDERKRVLDVLIHTAEGSESVAKEDFDTELKANGIELDDHRLSYHIRMAELDGILCNGNLLPMKPSYAIAERKIPRTSSISREEALLRFATRYFQSHSPATLEDFAWWSGLTMSDCKKAIAMLGNHLTTFQHTDRQFYLLDTCRTRLTHKHSLLLLPPYDEYLIGYKSRDLVLTPEVKHKAHNNSGIFYPVVVSDGVVCANWKPYEKKLIATPFPNYSLPEQLDEAWNDYIAYLLH